MEENDCQWWKMIVNGFILEISDKESVQKLSLSQHDDSVDP